MKIKQLNNRKGVTLTELMIGIAVFIIFLTMGMVSLTSITTGRIRIEKNRQVERKLRAVGELIRYETAYRWASMTDTVGTVRLPDMHPEVEVIAYVDEIDPTTRTRLVTLDAKWKELRLTGYKTKQIKFLVSKVRAKTSGATVRARVVDASDNPVEGCQVTVTVPQGQNGQDGPISDKETDVNGEVVFTGVRVLGTGVGLQVNCKYGKSSVNDCGNFYFKENPVTNSTFVKTFQTDETKAGEVNDYLYHTAAGGPGKMPVNAPATIEGEVQDYYASSTKVEDARIFIHPLSQHVIYPMITTEKEQTTDANGIFKYDCVMPGTYLITMNGNDAYAAFARPQDAHTRGSDSTADQLTLDTGQADVTYKSGGSKGPWRAVPKGHLKGRVYGVRLNAGDFESDTTTDRAPSGMQIRYRQYAQYTWYDPGTPEWFDFRETTAYGSYFGQSYYYHQGDTDSNGDYVIQNIGPSIIHQDIGTYDPDDQFEAVDPRTRNYWPPSMPDPLLPIIVRPSTFDPSGASFSSKAETDFQYLIITPYGERYIKARPYDPSPPATFDDFEQKVYPNAYSNNPDKDIYFLDRNALANIQGTLTDQCEHPCTDFTTSLSYKRIYANWGDAFGGVLLRSADVDQAYIHPHIRHNLAATVAEYDLADKYIGIVPSFADDTMTIRFYGRNTAPETLSFLGEVEVFVKRKIGDDAVVQQLSDLSDVDVTLKVRGYRYRNSSQVWSDNNFIIEDGEFGVAGAGNSETLTGVVSEYWGSTSVDAPPGQAVIANINVGAPATNRELYHIWVYDSSDDGGSTYNSRYLRNWPYGGHLRKGPVFEYDGVSAYSLSPNISNNDHKLSLIKQVEVKVEGYVTDISPSPAVLPNVNVNLYRYGVGSPHATTVTNSSGYYVITTMVPPQLSTWDIKIVYDKTGYDSVTSSELVVWEPDGAGNPVWERNLDLSMGLTEDTSSVGTGTTGN